MERKYRFLRIAATIFRVIGWIVLVVGVIASILMGTFMGVVTGIEFPALGGGIAAFYVIFGILYSVIVWVSFLAFAEIFCLLIDLEQNTRETADRLRTGSTDRLT